MSCDPDQAGRLDETKPPERQKCTATTSVSFEKMRPQNRQTPHSKTSAVKCKNCRTVSQPQRKRASRLQLSRRCRVEKSYSWLSFLRKRGLSIIARQLQSPI